MSPAQGSPPARRPAPRPGQPRPGQPRPGQPRPASARLTLRTVAEDLGVSRATVSNAYNHPDQLSAALRLRILARAAELGFAGPDPTARSLRSGNVGVVGVLVDQGLSYAFSHPAAVLMLDGLASEIQPDGSGLLIHSGAAGDSGLDHVRNAAVDVWVVQSLADGDPAIAAARARNRPLVVLDQPELPGVPLISVDDRGGGAAAMRHLTGLGHRRIAVLTMPLTLDRRVGPADDERQQHATYRVMRERLAGARAAALEAGVSWDQVRVMECASNDADGGAAGALQLLAMIPRPTAIIALSDPLALGALRAAQDTDVHVPDQVSVVGFDDSPPAEHAQPPLTTISQPLRERGQRAGAIVRALLAGENPGSPEPYDVHLVVRESTARPF